MRFQRKLLQGVFFSLIFCLLFIKPLRGQSQSQFLQVSLDKGIRFDAPDSSIGLKLGMRLQTQFSSTLMLEKDENAPVESQVKTRLRRARFLYSGYLMKKEFTYFIQYQFDKG